MQNNNAIFFQVTSSSNTETITDDPYWISSENTLELTELFSVLYIRLA